MLLGPARRRAAPPDDRWQNGSFSENVGGVVSRSNVVIGKANTAATQFLPLGNGSLGVAAWAANGFTAQLNRSDTMPNRLSPGQVNIPGLSAMTSASNFVGHLDLYNGVLLESGGGMTLTAWVPAGKDELVVDVTGANPGTRQTATREPVERPLARPPRRPGRSAAWRRPGRTIPRPATRTRPSARWPRSPRAART